MLDLCLLSVLYEKFVTKKTIYQLEPKSSTLK